MKTVKFYTLGCKVNQYDTQSIREGFIQAGFKELEDSQPAQVYLINTCTVTHKADSESLNLIRKAKRENPKARLIVTGCLAELDPAKIKAIGGVNCIVKSKQNWGNGISYFKAHTRAFLKIQEGCDNRCSYCRVPYARGPARSRPLSEIIAEATRLVTNGFKEIVLCGICLGAYGKDLKSETDLVKVIDELQNIPGLSRIRLSSIEAGDVSEGLIDRIAGSLKLCRHLHIPMQSGDAEILKKMNRRYSPKEYLNLVQKIKSRIPGIAITTDVLVGFPGESDENFRNTAELIKEIQPLKVHIFGYSPREGTQAQARYGWYVDSGAIKKRITCLNDIARACSLKYREQFLNKRKEVLVEAISKYKTGFWEGRTDNYIKVLLKSNLRLKNELVKVKLKEIFGACVLA